jgi:hypothetical protein
MNIPHQIRFRDLREAEELAAKALELFPDRMQPEADRSSLRQKWVAAVRYMRPRGICMMDRNVERVSHEAA